MLKRSLCSRSLTTKGVTEYEVSQAIEGLLKGTTKVADVPTRLCKSIISTMTQMRKDALLQRKDSLAAKMDDLLGELQYGPQKYQFDCTENPTAFREKSVRLNAKTPEASRLSQTGKTLLKGAKVDSIDSITRQSCTPTLKTKRTRELSRARYSKSATIDSTVDACNEYEIDSRRLAPRLMKVQAIQQKLDEARANYEMYRERSKGERQKYEDLEAAAQEELEDRLKQELLDYGSHVPTSLPLEFSKFSGKVLDMRERERKSASMRMYDNAQTLRTEAVKKEKEELDALSQRFARSFNLQRQRVLSKQEQSREAFKELWVRKKEKNQRDLKAKMSELRRAVVNLEKDLAEAQQVAGCEMARIQNNQRILSTPIASKQAVVRH